VAKLTPLVIFGAGGFAREVLELVRDINAERPRFELLGFLDDREELWKIEQNGVRILGGIRWLETQAHPPNLVLGLGNPSVKRRIVERVRARVADFPTLIHPTVVKSTSVEQGAGVIMTAGNILTANIRVADFTTLNLACTIGHDVITGAYCTIAPGVNISGNVTIGEGCDIGTGAAIIQGLSIGEWSVIGAGAVVTTDLPANCTAVGIPARPIKHRETGWHL
jgi:sugar O-acyltransferase (sialic acid O-acetyltransferase NeuD family)